MDSKSFGARLKEIRLSAGKTVSEVSSYLTSLGYKASEKTIYSWEAGRSQPTPDPFLDLCKYCGVDDVLSVFGYKESPSTAEAAPGEELSQVFDYLCNGLEAMGMIAPGEDISEQQADVLLGICAILRATFNGSH